MLCSQFTLQVLCSNNRAQMAYTTQKCGWWLHKTFLFPAMWQVSTRQYWLSSEDLLAPSCVFVLLHTSYFIPQILKISLSKKKLKIWTGELSSVMEKFVCPWQAGKCCLQFVWILSLHPHSDLGCPGLLSVFFTPSTWFWFGRNFFFTITATTITKRKVLWAYVCTRASSTFFCIWIVYNLWYCLLWRYFIYLFIYLLFMYLLLFIYCIVLYTFFWLFYIQWLYQYGSTEINNNLNLNLNLNLNSY
jgi:hypothetical protein